jgi:NADH-ubiquinone oxidoreductase chain 5
VIFIISINLLIFIPNIVTLLIGWDGLGLTSFLLVIYYQNPKSLAAGIITALTNRIGDVLILTAIGIRRNSGHWLIINKIHHNIEVLVTWLIIIAAITKRAQIPFSRWLPSAIAAPTPVSALVHSSTLVTAGIFLLIRFSPNLIPNKWATITLLILSSLTMLMAGINAMVETDIKKIIALSTLRQLGVMITRISLNLTNLAFFHLITHAIFKALLFICAGRFIHFHSHSQDLRDMGRTRQQLPLTTACLLSANIALCGLPFIAGFYSKDLIIETLLFNINNITIIIIFLIATILTAAYSTRLTLSITTNINITHAINPINNNDKIINYPTIILSIGAITLGSVINWTHTLPTQEPFLPTPLKIRPLICSIVGFIWMYQIFSIKTPVPIKTPIVTHANSLIWFLTPLSTQQIIHPTFILRSSATKYIDQRWLEYIGPNGISNVLNKLFIKLNIKSTSLITSQLTTILMIIFLTLINYLNSLIWKASHWSRENGTPLSKQDVI